MDVPAGGRHRPAPAPRGRASPGSGRPLELDEFHAATATTAFQVLVDGVLVHAWYADGLGPRDLFLGASATKSVLAHLVGRAGLDLDAPVDALRAGATDSGYRGVPVRDVARMTSGVDWVEDHRDPDGPATALVGAFATGGSLARAADPGPPAPPARHPVRLLHGRLPGARLGARTRHRRRLPRRARRAVAATWDAPTTRWSPSTATGWPWPAAGSPPRPETGPGWACSRSTVTGGRSAARPAGSTAAVAAVPARPADSPRPCRRTLGFGYHWWPLDDAGTARGRRRQPRPVRLRRPSPAHGRREDVGRGPTPTPPTTRTAAT